MVVKNLLSCKPDSVPTEDGRYHLSGRVITNVIYLPTLRCWPLAEPLDEPSSTTGIHGISAYKVYPHCTSLYNAVGSYPTFSPFPGFRRVVIFCGTVCKRLPAPRLLTGVSPCAVRTFLDTRVPR
jgi:hypothetical protein